MGSKSKSISPQPRIIVGLPNLQDQIGMINRVTDTASDLELERWEGMRELLSELYSQLQRQKQVTVYRLANKKESKIRTSR